jgi:predicted esterase
MKRIPLAGVALACLAAARMGASPAPDASAIDRAFQEFLGAPDQAAAARRADAVVKSGVPFDEAVARLRRGREYSTSAARGTERGRHRTFDGVEHDYTFVVPANYDPSRQYRLRVQLHGGVSRPEQPDPNRLGIGRLPGTVEEISVFPSAWADSLWWQASQVDNLAKILDKLKRTYNVDENRVYLTGISDGGTGAYFMAFRDTTPWASFLPLNGNMLVLASPEVGADGEMFPGNAVNKPFFVVNGGLDRLYPAHIVQPYVEHLEKLGADVVFHVQPDADHNTDWWPEERAAYEAFVDGHPRDPLPDKLSWETERTDRYNRAHWLVIDRLGDVAGQAKLADSNLLLGRVEYDFGLRISSNIDGGRRVLDVAPNSNAYRIGLRPGDLILDVEGRTVQTARDIVEPMQQWAIGRTVRVTVERAGRSVSLEGPFQPDQFEAPGGPIFPRGKPSGRIDLARHANVVEASTRGVRAFTLLLSPSKFDLTKPVRVVANGRTVFEGPVAPSVATLLKWAARDNDRTMLFGAELTVDLTK